MSRNQGRRQEGRGRRRDRAAHPHHRRRQRDPLNEHLAGSVRRGHAHTARRNPRADERLRQDGDRRGLSASGWGSPRPICDFWALSVRRGADRPWTVWPKAGAFDADPYTRAIVARKADSPLGNGEGFVFVAREDSDGAALDGSL